ncbi:MAG: hypothetical protein WBN44_04450, partial [Woeseiaceae bacterium]
RHKAAIVKNAFPEQIRRHENQSNRNGPTKPAPLFWVHIVNVRGVTSRHFTSDFSTGCYAK